MILVVRVILGDFCPFFLFIPRVVDTANTLGTVTVRTPESNFSVQNINILHVQCTYYIAGTGYILDVNIIFSLVLIDPAFDPFGHLTFIPKLDVPPHVYDQQK